MSADTRERTRTAVPRRDAVRRRPRPRARLSVPGDPLEREADRIAESMLSGRGVPSLSRIDADRIDRAMSHASDEPARDVPPIVREPLRSSGQPLDRTLRGVLETGLGHDLGRVRIHADASAARAAEAIDARAYTVGSDVVFGRNAYDPETRAGRHLIAHEVAHAVQQRHAAAGPVLVQRRSIFESIGIFFGLIEGHFDEIELRAYLKKIGDRGKPEGDYDSDNKARAVVRQWKANKTKFRLDARLKALLIREMQDGPTLDDDENAILDLLNGSDDADLREIFTTGKVSVSDLNGDFDGDEYDRLKDFYRAHGGIEAVRKGQAKSTTQPAGAGAPTGAPPVKVFAGPRKDYVFLMGQDRRGATNQFFTAAERFYRERIPDAVFVKNAPTLRQLLEYIDLNVKDPIGNLFIVSHANEDGTLSFGLEPGDADSKLSVGELRDALKATGLRALPNVKDKFDVRTRVHIKGCDIGRTREMVELLDQAFGGEETVTAPTHEQEYGFDPDLAKAAVKAEHPEIEKRHPMPPAVDSTLKGAEKRKALAERKRLLAERAKAIAAEEKAVAEKAGVFEAFSGPMFQRPGTKLFTAAELAPEIKRLYGHLSEKQQASLAQRLTARDPRSEAVADQVGTYGQQGQRVYRKRLFTFTFGDPRSLAEVTAAGFTYPKGFRPKQMGATTRATDTDGTTLTIRVEGRTKLPGQDAYDDVVTFTSGPVPPDADMLKDARTKLPNPDRYAFRIAETHARNGITTRAVIAERVLAYLHHGSLDPSAHEHFTRPESDPSFFATSTFTPPTPGGGKP